MKNLSNMVPAKRVDASGLEHGKCCSQCSFGNRCSMI